MGTLVRENDERQATPGTLIQELRNTLRATEKTTLSPKTSKQLRKAEVLGWETRNVGRCWLTPVSLSSRSPVKEHAAGIPLDFTQLHPNYGPGQNSPTELATWRATHMLQGLGRTALFSNSPYVNNALEAIVTHGGGSPDSPPKRRGKVRPMGSKHAAIRRAKMALSHTTPFLPQVAFTDAIRVACIHNDKSAVPPLIDAYILSRPRLPVDVLDGYTQVLAVQLPSIQLQAVQILVQKGYYFTAIKTIFDDKQVLQATLEEIELIITRGLVQSETGDHAWNWKEADKELLVHQFSNLRIIGYYCELRRQLHMLHHGQGMAALVKVEQEMLIKVIRDFKAQVGQELALIVIEQERLAAEASLAAQSSVASIRSNRSHRCGAMRLPKSPTATSPAKKQAADKTSPVKPASKTASGVDEVAGPASSASETVGDTAAPSAAENASHSDAAVAAQSADAVSTTAAPQLAPIAEESQTEQQEEEAAATSGAVATSSADTQQEAEATSEAAQAGSTPGVSQESATPVAAVGATALTDTAKGTPQSDQAPADAPGPSMEEPRQQDQKSESPVEGAGVVNAEPSLLVPQQEAAAAVDSITQEPSLSGQPVAEPTLSDFGVVLGNANAADSLPEQIAAADGTDQASTPSSSEVAATSQTVGDSKSPTDQAAAVATESAAATTSDASGQPDDASQPVQEPQSALQEAATVAGESGSQISEAVASSEQSPAEGDQAPPVPSETPTEQQACKEGEVADGAKPSDAGDDVQAHTSRPMSRMSTASSMMGKSVSGGGTSTGGAVIPVADMFTTDQGGSESELDAQRALLAAQILDEQQKVLQQRVDEKASEVAALETARSALTSARSARSSTPTRPMTPQDKKVVAVMDSQIAVIDQRLEAERQALALLEAERKKHDEEKRNLEAQLANTMKLFQEQLSSTVKMVAMMQAWRLRSGAPPSDMPVVPEITLPQGVDDPPTEDEIKEYAQYLGIDVEADEDLLYIAEWALTAPVPDGWTVHLDANGQEFFYNAALNKSQYEHPMDQHYKEYYQAKKTEKKQKLAAGPKPVAIRV